MSDMEFARRELCVVCEKGNTKRLKQLIEFGVDVNKEVDGRSFLHRAATFGQHMSVKLLVRAGAVPSRQDLVAAVASSSRHSADYINDALLDHDIDPTAFSWISVLQRREFMESLTAELAQWMIDNGADVRETDTFGRNGLQLAVEHGSPEVAEVFRAAL